MASDPDQAPACAPGDEPRVLAASGFPNVARLELDELLEQLIERARDVQATQGRLRGLLRAYREIASAVDLDEVLSHILGAARTLVDARYAALGVVDQGRLVRFLHVGMDDDTVTAIGHLPEGKGLLGRLIDYPQPLRLDDIAAHVASVGFPDRHPPMRSFLGVPIRVGSQIFGNLYLTDKQDADTFSPDDEELVTALAGAAGAAITNAAAYTDATRRQQWHAAMAEVSTAILTSDDPDRAPALLLRHAVATARCVGGSVAMPIGDGQVRVVAGEGLLADRVGVVAAIEGSVYGEAMAGREIVTITELATDPRATGNNLGDVGAMLAVPLLTDVGAEGVLFVCRRTGEPQFDTVDTEMLATYAAHAALVLQLSGSRRDNEALRRADDRLHIAGDLQTGIITKLSRLGLDLQAAAGRVADPQVRDSLQERVADTDRIIHALRDAIFSLNRPPQ